MENILVRLKKILNTYTDEELKVLELWIDSSERIESLFIEEFNINLITKSAIVDINNKTDKEAS